LCGNMPPIAYTNPIFLDVDHNGFQANGDTPGHPLPVTPPEHILRGRHRPLAGYCHQRPAAGERGASHFIPQARFTR
jgi:hypothetical protein